VVTEHRQQARGLVARTSRHQLDRSAPHTGIGIAERALQILDAERGAPLERAQNGCTNTGVAIVHVRARRRDVAAVTGQDDGPPSFGGVV
jgi:hypothetical protein